MDDFLISWVELCFGFFNDMINSCVTIITSSPDSYNNIMYNTAIGINKAILPIATTIMFIYFFMDFLDKTIDFGIKDYKAIVKLVFRLTFAKIVLDGNTAILVAIFKIVGLLVSATMSTNIEVGVIDITPVADAISDLSFLGQMGAMLPIAILGLFNLLASLSIFIIIGAIFIELYMYIALAPLPLSSFASSRQRRVGENFLKTYTATALKSLVIIIIIMICRHIEINMFSDETNFVFLLFNMFIKVLVLAIMIFSSGKISNAVVGKG